MLLSPGVLLLISVTALLAGGVVGYLIAQYRRAGRYLPAEEVASQFVRREVHEQTQRDADVTHENLQEKLAAERVLIEQLATYKSNQNHLQQRLDGHQLELQRLQQASLAQFERTAERLFQEKSKRFTAENATQLKGILQPLRERIEGFEQQVERRFLEETRDRVTLRQEIKHLQELNTRISTEANNLAGALRGNSKTQGDWGEWQLLTLLEASGLQQNVHFTAQGSYRDADDKVKRPDFIINLPDDKHLVIDSKVSLTAYDRYRALCGPRRGTPRARPGAPA